MKRFLGWMFHPVTMIVVVNIAWTVALVFWILYFLRRYRQVEDLALETGLRAQDLVSWAPLVVGILLLFLIFAGTIALILALARQAIVNKQMRNFLSFVSHELRTPLTSISLFLETMRDQDLDPDTRNEFIENMLQDTERLTRQIAGILDASRLERQKMPLRKELLDLERFVREYAAQKGPAVASSGRELVLGDVAICTVLGDRELLRSALDNLVRNSERYSDEGTTITLSLTESGKSAVIEVQDQGIGIEPKERKKIFNLFYRTASGRRASGSGSGLGLYIVKGIVGLHRGNVILQSEGPGKGARFSIRLPQVGQGQRSV
jgi:signal transduction histidine kinase